MQCDRNIKVESDDEQDEQHSLREIWELSQKIHGYALKTNITALLNYMLKAQDELRTRLKQPLAKKAEVLRKRSMIQPQHIEM